MVSFSMPYSNRRDDAYVSVRVEDKVSSQPIVEFELDANTFVSLLRGGLETVRGWVLPAELRSRLGKELMVHSQVAPEVVVPRYAYTEEDLAKVRLWATGRLADLQIQDEGWDHFRVDRTNQGFKVVFYGYKDPAKED